MVKCIKQILDKSKLVLKFPVNSYQTNFRQVQTCLKQSCQFMSYKTRQVTILAIHVPSLFFNISRLFQIAFDAIWYNCIISWILKSYVNMSRLVLNHKMMKYSKIWANGTKKVFVDDNNFQSDSDVIWYNCFFSCQSWNHT